MPATHVVNLKVKNKKNSLQCKLFTRATERAASLNLKQLSRVSTSGICPRQNRKDFIKLGAFRGAAIPAFVHQRFEELRAVSRYFGSQTTSGYSYRSLHWRIGTIGNFACDQFPQYHSKTISIAHPRFLYNLWIPCYDLQ